VEMCCNSGNFYSGKILTSEKKNLKKKSILFFFTLLKFRVGGSVKLKIKKCNKLLISIAELSVLNSFLLTG